MNIWFRRFYAVVFSLLTGSEWNRDDMTFTILISDPGWYEIMLQRKSGSIVANLFDRLAFRF